MLWVININKWSKQLFLYIILPDIFVDIFSESEGQDWTLKQNNESSDDIYLQYVPNDVVCVPSTPPFFFFFLKRELCVKHSVASKYNIL